MYDVIRTLTPLAVLLLTLAVSRVEALDKCPDKCMSCDIPNGFYQCRSAGLDEFPSNLPAPNSVKELLLSENEFSEINLLHLMLYRNIIKLDMTNCKLTDIDETTFQHAKNLSELRLADNFISELKPKTFQGLGQLTFLDLTGNGLSRLPGNLFLDLAKLEKLDLSRNLLVSLDGNAFLGLISLHLLDVSVNELRSVPVDSLSAFPSLRSLSLGGNAIDVIPSHAFRSLKNLQKLQLQDNQISSLSNLAFHGKDNVELPKLKYLSLRTNRLSTVPLSSLQNLSALLTLDLSNNPISSLQKDSFTGLTRLRKLYLNEMPKLRTIAPYTFSAMINLEELQLHTNTELKHLPSMTLGRLPNLVQFDLSHDSLTTLDENLMEDWNQLEVFDLRLNPWHCNCDLAWLGEYLKNHSSTRLMSSVQCKTPPILLNKPVITIDTSTCLSIGEASPTGGQSHLSTVLWILIGCVIGALFVVGLYVLYRNKGKCVKQFHDQMRYRAQEDQGGESMSSRLSMT